MDCADLSRPHCGAGVWRVRFLHTTVYIFSCGLECSIRCSRRPRSFQFRRDDVWPNYGRSRRVALGDVHSKRGCATAGVGHILVCLGTCSRRFSNFDPGTRSQRFSVGRYRLLVGLRLSRESGFNHASAFHSFFTMAAPKAKR